MSPEVTERNFEAAIETALVQGIPPSGDGGAGPARGHSRRTSMPAAYVRGHGVPRCTGAIRGRVQLGPVCSSVSPSERLCHRTGYTVRPSTGVCETPAHHRRQRLGRHTAAAWSGPHWGRSRAQHVGAIASMPA